MEQDQAWVQGQIECIAPSEVSTASSMVMGPEADSAIDGGLAVRCLNVGAWFGRKVRAVTNKEGIELGREYGRLFEAQNPKWMWSTGLMDRSKFV
uniref:Uncharacterized protein n=1 Tax=Aegilops tauschii TaxID=37682 RepID=M8AZL9_AEGTA